MLARAIVPADLIICNEESMPHLQHLEHYSFELADVPAVLEEAVRGGGTDRV